VSDRTFKYDGVQHAVSTMVDGFYGWGRDPKIQDAIWPAASSFGLTFTGLPKGFERWVLLWAIRRAFKLRCFPVKEVTILSLPRIRDESVVSIVTVAADTSSPRAPKSVRSPA